MPASHADVPLAKDPSERFLPWLVAFMVYFAALALISGLALHKLIERWDSGLTGQWTVEVPAPQLESDPAEQTVRIQRILALLKQAPGVISAARLAPSQIAELLEPWLGSGALNEDLPLPTLIAVTVSDGSPPDLDALAAEIGRIAPGALIDDHQRWLGRLLDLARSMQAVTAVILALVTLCAVLAVVFVTRTGLSVHQKAIELLHLMGAHDAYIARQFQRHALKLGLRGGVVGVALGLLTILPVGHLIGRMENTLLAGLALSPVEWGLLAVLPVATALVAMVTARLTVLATLARMP